MHEQIFIAALIVQFLTLALRPWRELEFWEPPIHWTPPRHSVCRGLWPVREKKGPRAEYPAGFA